MLYPWKYFVVLETKFEVRHHNNTWCFATIDLEVIHKMVF